MDQVDVQLFDGRLQLTFDFRFHGVLNDNEHVGDDCTDQLWMQMIHQALISNCLCYRVVTEVMSSGLISNIPIGDIRGMSWLILMISRSTCADNIDTEQCQYLS